jgi:hypothetical protein
MIVVVVFGAVIAGLFAAAYFSKRRFGLLGLALTAGATLSSMWSYDAGLVVSSLGVVPEGPTTQAVTLSLVTLLPTVLLLFHGYTYKKKLGRIVGSLLFTALAVAFLVEPIGYVLPLEGTGADVYEWLKANREVIISIGVLLAVFDLFLTKPVKTLEKESKKK